MRFIASRVKLNVFRQLELGPQLGENQSYQQSSSF
jgi:hypothetical protein